MESILQRRHSSSAQSNFKFSTALYLKELFSIDVPTPNPPFPRTFTNLIPKIDTDVKRINFEEKDKAKALLHLEYTERLIILSSIEENKYTILLSEENKQYSAAIILQSIASLCYYESTTLDFETSIMLLNLIIFVCDIFPQNKYLISKTFYLIYEKLLTSKNITDYIHLLTKISSLIDITLDFYADIHVKALICLINIFNLKFDEKIATKFNDFVKQIEPIYSRDDIKFENIEIIDRIYESFSSLKLNEIWGNFTSASSIHTFYVSIMNLVLKLERITSHEFKLFGQIIREILNINPLLPQRPSIRVQPMIENDEISQVQLIKIDESQLPSSSDFYLTIPTISIIENTPTYCLFDGLTYGGEILPALKKLLQLEKTVKDINLKLLILLMVCKAPNTTSEMYKILEKYESLNILFDTDLIYPEITLFDDNYPKSLIVARSIIQSTIYRFIIDSPTNQYIVNQIEMLLNIIKFYPELFTEYILMYQKVFTCFLENRVRTSEILDLFVSEIHIQQNCFLQKTNIFEKTEENIDNSKNSERYFPLFIKLLSNILTNVTKWDPSTFFMHRIYSTLLTLIFNSAVTDEVHYILSTILPIAFKKFEEQYTDIIYSPLIERAIFSNYNMTSNPRLVNIFLSLIWESTISSDAFVQRTFAKSDMINTLVPIMYTQNIGSSNIALVLKIIGFNPMHNLNEDLTDYRSIAKLLTKVGITQEIYEACKIILSGSSSSFCALENVRAYHLINAIFDSGFCIDFMSSLDKLVKESVPAIFDCFHAGVLPKLFKIANSLNDKDTIELCFSIFEKIASHVSDRQTFLEFTNYLKPKNNRQSNLMPHLLNSLLILSAQTVFDEHSLMKVSRNNGTIELPPIKLCQSGTNEILVFDLRVNGLSSTSFLPLFNFSNTKENINLSANLFADKLQIRSNILKEFPCKFKSNVWNRFCIEFKSIDDITFYINGNKVGDNNTKSNASNIQQFDQCFLFPNGADHEVQAHFRQFALLENYEITSIFSQKDLNELSNKNFVISTENMFGKKFVILGSNYFLNANGQVFKNINPFIKYFMIENGIDYVLQTITQIDYVNENGIHNEYFLNQFIDAIFCLMSTSDIVMQRMLELDGFSVMAYYLSRSKTLKLDSAFWMKICQIGHALKDQQLLTSFYINLSLNYSIWKYLDMDVQFEVFQYWKTTANTKYKIFCAALPAIRIVDVIISLFNQQKLNEQCLQILIDVLCILLINSYKSSDMNSIDDLFKTLSNNQAFFILATQRLKSVQSTKMELFYAISYTIVSAKWISSITSAELLRNIADDYAWTVDDSFIPFFMNYLEGRKIDFLQEFSNILVGKSNIEISELVKYKKTWMINADVFPFVLINACFADPKILNETMYFISVLFIFAGTRDTISTIMKPLTSMLLFVLFLFLEETIFEPFILYLTSSVDILRFALNVYTAIEVSTKVNLDNFLLTLLEKSIKFIFSQPQPVDKQKYLDLFVDYICFRPFSNIEENERIQLTDLKPFDIIMALKGFSFPQFNFSPRINQGKLFFEDALMNLSSYIIGKPFNLAHLIIPLSFCLENKTICDVLDEIWISSGKNKTLMIPIIYQASKSDIDGPKFIKDGEKTKISREIFEVYQKIIKTYSQEKDFKLININKLFYEMNEIISLIKDNDEYVSINELEKQTIEKLEKTASEFENNILNSKFPDEFGRGFHFDNQFKLILHQPLNKTNSRCIKSIINQDDSILRTNATLVDLKVSENGIFGIKKDCVYFVSSKINIQIYNKHITYIFIGPNEKSMQIFSKDGSTLHYFIFETQNYSNLVEKIDCINAKFVQKNDISQVFSNLCSRWQGYKISTFEFIMWINLISGRCMNDLNYYPIFPAVSNDFVPNDAYKKFMIKLGCDENQELEDDVFPPDFFYDTEFLEGKSNVFDLITKLSFKLETDNHTTWISKHFPHLASVPTREIRSSFEFSKTETKYFFEQPPICVSFDENVIIAVLANLVAISSAVVPNQFNIDLDKAITTQLLPTTGNLLAFIGTEKLIYSPENSTDIYIFDNKTTKLPLNSPHLGSITNIFVSAPYLVSTGSDMIAVLYHMNDKNVSICSTLSAHVSPIVAGAVSASISIVATFSSDSILVISSIPNLLPLRKITFQGKPKFVRIGEQNGIIVAVTEKDSNAVIHVYSINGDFICSKEFADFVQDVQVYKILMFDIIVVQFVTEIRFYDFRNLEQVSSPLKIDRGYKIAGFNYASNTLQFCNANQIILSKCKLI